MKSQIKKSDFTFEDILNLVRKLPTSDQIKLKSNHSTRDTKQYQIS